MHIWCFIREWSSQGMVHYKHLHPKELWKRCTQGIMLNSVTNSIRIASRLSFLPGGKQTHCASFLFLGYIFPIKINTPFPHQWQFSDLSLPSKRCTRNQTHQWKQYWHNSNIEDKKRNNISPSSSSPVDIMCILFLPLRNRFSRLSLIIAKPAWPEAIGGHLKSVCPTTVRQCSFHSLWNNCLLF